jgi:hypothetical protein
VHDTPGDDALVAAILALARWLSSQNVPYASIGGVAVALQAAPRFTQDVDAVVWIDDGRWAAVVESAAPFAIVPRRADILDFARRTRVLLLSHAGEVPIDVSCGALPFEQTLIERATRIQIDDVPLRVARPEDLLVMKAVANRARDRADIETLLRQFPNMDTTAARETVKEFADVLESPELLADFDRALRESSKP